MSFTHLVEDGLAREYLNRPELTAEKFIRDPFSDDPSARLYKTGDRARYLCDGSIDFVGRVDRQVKIRGFRIELQEIEAALSQHRLDLPVRHRRAAECLAARSLVAYFVPFQWCAACADALRRFLREKLPDYMVPSAFVMLDSLPLTPNGKVDTARLPEPGQDRHEQGPDFAEPRTSIEKGIARIWEELLGVARVGIHDNFFDLGGHSLLAPQLITRIEKRDLEGRCRWRFLFQSPTIEQLGRMFAGERLGGLVARSYLFTPERLQVAFSFGFTVIQRMRCLPQYLGHDRPLYALEHQAHDGRPLFILR